MPGVGWGSASELSVMSSTIKIYPEKFTPETKCQFCTSSKCCTYITQHIPTPRSKAEFDFLLWQVSHHHVEIYKDEEGWFLLINTPCSHIQTDGRCGIYATRPQICRDYDNDYCEFDEPAEGNFELHFKDHAALLAYCRKRFKNWDQWQFDR